MRTVPFRPRRSLTVALLLGAALPLTAALAAQGPTSILQTAQQSPATVVAADGSPAPAAVKVVRDWTGNLCRARLVNEGKTPVKIKEVVLLDLAHALPPETVLYGEGFTMLSQTVGTLGKPIDLAFADRKHYKIPQPADATVVYGLLTLSPPKADHLLLAFTSCKRFIGRFYVRPRSIQAVLDTENLTLEAGTAWDLEELMIGEGGDRNALLAALAERINKNHPPLHAAKEPTGWCSWYCFGPRVTSQQVLDNLDVISKDVPALKYVLIDDGYQPAMGDWLETGPAFGGGVQDVLKKIRAKGFEPALWVAPFIAEKNSKLFKEHPDWFIQDDAGKPLSADKVTFGGWRKGPWYALDGTHPAVQKHLEELFRVLRQLWGVVFFKLDANFWGAMHGGKFHDAKATRIEAYRRGMDAILRGAGDGFVLGCNHPIWPSFGKIHGSRSSSDIKREWARFARTARENLYRGWQNGRLWWNDPDCALLTGKLTDDEYRFHATAIYASGGMLLSGDDLTKIGAARAAMLKKLLPPTGTAAEFEDEKLQVGYVRLKGKTAVCLLNWGEQPQTLSFKLQGPCVVRDFWSGEDLGRHEGTFEVKGLPKHSGRVLVCEPVGPQP
jgi:alpha-galactosidase